MVGSRFIYLLSGSSPRRPLVRRLFIVVEIVEFLIKFVIVLSLGDLLLTYREFRRILEMVYLTTVGITAYNTAHFNSGFAIIGED